MVFSSLLFMFIFLPVSLLLYYICPPGKNFRIRNALLFFISMVFYAWGEPVYFILMLFAIFINYIFAILIYKYEHKAKLLLAISIIINLSMLAFFKYSAFFVSNLNIIFGISIPVPNIVLPVGISFYTFQSMSYTIDVYRKDAPLQKNFLSFGAYVALFPQLIAGPIVRYKSVADQLIYRQHNIDKFSAGIMRFTQGFAKKVLIANNVGLIWDEVFIGNNISTMTAWLGIIAFSLQIYFDFSGYSDMAIGLGRMFGFEFCENFDYPYISKSITEFWRRWHISLGTWFKEYVYIPLGGNRKGKIRTYFNLMIVWFLTGLWHGAGWNFILWGVYFGILLIFEKLFLLRILRKIPPLFAHIYSIFIVVVSWAFFAIEDFTQMKNFLMTMFGINTISFIDSKFIFLFQNNWVLFIMSAILCTPVIKKLKSKKIFAKISPVIFMIIWITGTAFLVSDSYNPFLYFKF